MVPRGTPRGTIRAAAAPVSGCRDGPAPAGRPNSGSLDRVFAMDQVGVAAGAAVGDVDDVPLAVGVAADVGAAVVVGGALLLGGGAVVAPVGELVVAGSVGSLVGSRVGVLVLVSVTAVPFEVVVVTGAGRTHR